MLMLGLLVALLVFIVFAFLCLLHSLKKMFAVRNAIQPTAVTLEVRVLPFNKVLSKMVSKRGSTAYA